MNRIRNIVSLLILFWAPTDLFAQQQNYPMRVVYQLRCAPDSTSIATYKEELTELFINDRQAIFRSVNYGVLTSGDYQSESIRGFPASLFDMEILMKGQSIEVYESAINNQRPIGYRQQMKDFQWTLYDENKEILGLSCQKATMTYAGRDWEAWFSSDIPLPYGPYKFGNLPGLILEMKDSSNEWNFTVLQIESKPKRSLKTSLYFQNKGTQFFDSWHSFLNDQWNQLETGVDRFISLGARYKSKEDEFRARERVKKILYLKSNWIEIYR